MARLKVNHSCNVVTGEHTNGYMPPKGEPTPQITVPHLRLRLAIWEAEALAKDLIEAIAMAKAIEEGK